MLRPRCPTPGKRGKVGPSQPAPSPQDFLVSPGPPGPPGLGGPADRALPPVSVPQSADSHFTRAGAADLRRIDHLVIISIFLRMTPFRGGCGLTTAASVVRQPSTITCLTAWICANPIVCLSLSVATASALRCTTLCLPAGLGVTQLVRTGTDSNQSLLSPGYMPGLHGKTTHRDTRFRFRVRDAVCARPARRSTAHPQHWRSGHRSRAVLSAHRSPSQHCNAWRAGSCNVPCESPGARLGSGSGLRWHATRCEAKSQVECASVLTCHARRHRRKGSSEILVRGVTTCACVSDLPRRCLSRGGHRPRTAHRSNRPPCRSLATHGTEGSWHL